MNHEAENFENQFWKKNYENWYDNKRRYIQIIERGQAFMSL